jgi:hypothetical protein
MRTTTSSSDRRSIRQAVLTPTIAALVAVAVLGACQGDGPVAPGHTVRAADSSAAKVLIQVRPGFSLIDWQLQDANSPHNLLAGGHFHLSGPYNTSLDIIDNVTPNDQDPTTGKFKVTGLLPGAYTLCETVPPAKYMIPPAPANCFAITVYAQSSTTLSPIYNWHIPQLDWTVVDPAGNWLYNATFKVYDSTNTAVTIADNDPKDLNWNLGRFFVEVPTTGVYKVCETVPTTGFVLPAQPCKTIYASGGIQLVGDFVSNPQYSLYIDVSDNLLKPLGGASFVVKRQGYPNLDFNVTDNFWPDRDSKVGQMFVTVSGTGWYTVCQTSAPYGFDPPSGSAVCKSTYVYYGTPAGMGVFVDTPWPVAR